MDGEAHLRSRLKGAPAFGALAFAVCLSAFNAKQGYAYQPGSAEILCPVGGERFQVVNPETERRRSEMLTDFASGRPDGKPTGYPGYVSEPPVCPSNGLVVYREFTASEIARLRGFLQSADFEQMVGQETASYVAYRMQLFLDPESARRPETLFLLLQASWQSDEDVHRKQRYQDEFIEATYPTVAAHSLDSFSNDLPHLSIRVRLANALRERGRLPEAATVLQIIPRQALDVAVPAEIRRAVGRGWTTLNSAEVRDAEHRRQLLDYLRRMEGLMARGDTQSSPSSFWQ